MGGDAQRPPHSASTPSDCRTSSSTSPGSATISAISSRARPRTADATDGRPSSQPTPSARDPQPLRGTRSSARHPSGTASAVRTRGHDQRRRAQRAQPREHAFASAAYSMAAARSNSLPSARYIRESGPQDPACDRSHRATDWSLPGTSARSAAPVAALAPRRDRLRRPWRYGQPVVVAADQIDGEVCDADRGTQRDRLNARIRSHFSADASFCSSFNG